MRGWVSLFVLLAGCASSGGASRSSPPPEHQRFIWRTENDRQDMLLEGAELSGSRADIERFDDGYRGTLGSLHVALQASAERVTGQVGPQRVDLHVSRDGGALQLQGLCYPRLCSLRWSEGAFNGRQRDCGFELQRQGGPYFRYRGKYGCGTTIGFLAVELPLDLAKRSQAEQAGWLALFLMSL